jgi:receptor protein-tyrosine kinase
MSKIFEALQKSRGTSAAALPPLLNEQMTAATAVADEAEARDRVVAEEPRVQYEDSERQEVPQDMPQESAIRQVNLRVPSGLPVFPFDDAHATAAEQYRMIRTRIVQNLEPQKLILVSSPDSGDGKTITTLNMAGALALKSDVNVLILDADLCRPAVAKTLGIPSSPGLSEVLRGACALRDAVVRVGHFPNLYVLPAGEMVANRTELLDSPRWRSISATIRNQFHYTMVDAPPIDAVADYPLIQKACDCVIIVVRPDHTNRVRCMHALQNVPADKLIGAVINAAEDWFMLRNSHYHYYGYYNSYYPNQGDARSK